MSSTSRGPQGSRPSLCCDADLVLHLRYRMLLNQGRDVHLPPGAFVCVECGKAIGEGA